jgi:YVTN family beta-propeller protein
MRGYCDRARHLAYLWVLLAMPLAASTVRIYVTDHAGGSVHVIDPATNTVVQVIEGLVTPHGVNFSPDGSRIYISSEAEKVLDVLDRKTGNIIKKVPLSGEPNNITVTKDGGRVLVCIHEAPGALDIIDTTSLKLVKSIPMKAGLHNGYVTPDGKYAVVGSVISKILTVVDLQTEEPVWEVKFGGGVRTMAIEANPDGSTRRIFVQLHDLHGFAVVDFATHQEVARIILPNEPRIADFRDINTPSHGIGVSPDGKTLWVNSYFADAVFVYSLPDLKLLGHVSTGSKPQWTTFTPDGKMVYISLEGDNAVSAIDTKTMKEVARIPVGEIPQRNNTLVLP